MEAAPLNYDQQSTFYYIFTGTVGSLLWTINAFELTVCVYQ